jgi:hypothetical protein
MSILPTYDPFEVAQLVEARSIIENIAAEEASVQHEAEHALATLERTLAATADRQARVERLERWSVLLLDEMSRRDWPSFENVPVLIGTTKRKFRRDMPMIQVRTVLTRLGAGITVQGEFVEHRLSRSPSNTLIAPDDPKFDIYGFESFFSAFFDYHGIEPCS